jgi:hypothetical protein
MSFFVNEFDFAKDSAYRVLITARNVDGGIALAGTLGDKALAGVINPDGTPRWHKTYTIAGKVVRFISGVQCDNGDLLLHGSMVISDSRNQSLLVRVNSEGTVKWANAYTRDRTRFQSRLVKSTKDTYIFAGWYEQSSSVDDVEVVKIDGSGNVLKAVILDSSADDQLATAIAYNDGCILVGATSAGPGWDAFMVALDGDLRVTWQKLLGDGDFNEIRHIEQIGQDQFIVVGDTGAERLSFLAKLSPNDSSVPVFLYDLAPGSDYGSKRMVVSASNIYVAMTATTATPQTSVVACFNPDLSLAWSRALQLPKSHIFFDIVVDGERGQGLIVCGVTGTAPATSSLLVHTNAAFESCVTIEPNEPVARIVKWNFSTWAVATTPVTMTVTPQTLIVETVRPTPIERCPTGISIEMDPAARVQSPYVYLQAAGSDFSDQTVRGIHLRWDLLRRLGDHLPKGNLAAPNGPWPATIGFNRADDFVRIYRTEPKSDYGVDVFLGKPPATVFESGTVREWLYEDLVHVPGRTTDVSIRFLDLAQYDALRTNINPLTNPQALIAAYTGIIEARPVGKLAFLASFQLGPNPTAGHRLRVEALAIADPLDNATRRITCRRSVTATTNRPVVCENIEAIRFDYSGVVPASLHIATYEDFLRISNERREWFKVGDYSLDDGNGDADANVFARLENPTAAAVDNVWPKYQHVTTPGVFRVKTRNYRDRWRLPSDGLKAAVTTYLDASRQDVKAKVVVHNADVVPNDSTMEISYLDLLNFVSLDHHVARMLGLGTIDAKPAVSNDARFIYLMQYVTEGQLEHETASRITHFYMTPPVRIIDRKEPPPPSISLSYGLPPEECNGATSALTDAAGYAQFDAVRFVNLDRARFLHETVDSPFFATPAEFCFCEQTIPVAFGVSYGPGAIGSGNEVQPELSHNDQWLDADSIAEVSAIPERGANPVYTHQERTAGIHHYALYSINWFSRTGPRSAEVQTDATQFALRNTLLPPSNFAVQLIQNEEPRIFTTAAEQQRLSQLPAGDKTLVRVTFDWNHVHNQAYQYAKKVDLYFRTAERTTVRGQIVAVTEDPIAHTATITTTSYPIASTNPPQTVQPEILATNALRFVNARLAAEGQSWIVASVQSTGLNPTLVLKQIRTTVSISANLTNTFCTVEKWISPAVGDRFLLAENLEDPNAWDMKLAKEIPLAQFAPQHTETITNNDGQTRTLHVGGLTGAAVVAEIADPDPTLAPFIPPNAPLLPSGAYTVTFTTAQLPAMTDPDIQFHEGVIRMPDRNGTMKVLRVWRIDAIAGQLQLTVYDSEHSLQRDPQTGNFVLDSNNLFAPADGYVPVRTGSVPLANFHPSYRVYLKADLGTGRNFGEPAILPARDERTRQTLMAARSRDNAVTPELASPLSPPAVLLALELREPVAPGPPAGPLFATRPNFYGKATWTFDVQVGDPYMLVFYKANDRKILDQLYKPETARDLVAQFDRMSDFDAQFTTQRWSDLVHGVTDPDGLFIEHALNGFRFPIPDNADYAIPDPHPTPTVVVKPFDGVTPPGSNAVIDTTAIDGTTRTMKTVVREAIAAAFVPLTEAPLVYRQLHDLILDTSGRPPKVRNANGERLPAALADPWPMAVRYEKNPAGVILQQNDAGYGGAANTRWVRFTDYTLDGASKNLYFYFGVEMSNTMKTSPPSAIAGPVQLVNAAPPLAPVIRKVTAQLSDGGDVKPRVHFTISQYMPSEGVKIFRLYRALDPTVAVSVRRMDEAAEFLADRPLYDDFAGLADVPFAQPLYYRVVAFRQILNERGDPELVPSQPSDVAMTMVADAVHPEAPKITMTSQPLTAAHPFEYRDVRLTWPRTAYNGTYHLYKLNDLGTWVRIYSTTPTNVPVIDVPLADTSFGTDVLRKEDSPGNTLYHRFRVMVENVSGLVNLRQDELTV